MKTKKITKVSALIDYVIKLQGSQRLWMFRGQCADHPDWKLQPKIWRIQPRAGKRIEKIETELFKHFQYKGAMIDKTPDIYRWYWLFLAQHHGLATRLLDWSTNPLVAAFFAVEGDPLKYKGVLCDSVIFAYHARKADCDKLENPFNVKKISRVIPSHITSRIEVQSSIFTLHPPEMQTLTSEDENVLQKIIIPVSARERIFKELYRLNIYRGSLFPDLDNIARSIIWEESTSLKLPRSDYNINEIYSELLLQQENIGYRGPPLPPPPPPDWVNKENE